MMSLEAINDLSNQAAIDAAKRNLTPYVPFNADEIDTYGVTADFPFPNLGDHEPEGWEHLEDQWFVDWSGFGEEGEPALTQEQFRRELKKHQADTKGTIGYAITECGQFQLYVDAYLRVSCRVVA